jgi:osmotically-inducible protein OsmY
MNKTAVLVGLALVGTLACNRDQGPRTTTPAVSPPVTSQSSTTTEADRSLAAKVQDSFRQDATVAPAAQRVEVQARNGEVTLKGSVNTQQDKTALENKAQQVTGVTHVNNQLTVTSASR